MAIAVLAASAVCIGAAAQDGNHAQETEPISLQTKEVTVPDGTTFFIKEIRVKGAHHLAKMDIEAAIYPHLGPGRTSADVDRAAAALENAYRENGYQTVSVQIPQQSAGDGIIVLQVIEGTVGRLRVKGARYAAPSRIKAAAPSLAEGRVLNFNEIPHDIVALNQQPGRRVTPSLKPGQEPGTVDIDLEVKDEVPLHASVELNNRHGPDTTALRLNASVSGNNLWQRGHAAGLSYQTSPQKPKEVAVYSGYYLARFSGLENWTLMLQGTKQDSDVSTLGGVAVAGKGETYGVRLSDTLPGAEGFYHSVSIGLDFKYYRERLITGETNSAEPITSYPFSIYYNATWADKKVTTDAGFGVNFHVRGMGSSPAEFNTRRTKADGGYVYVHGTLSHERELPWGLQVFGQVQGQLSNQPLLSSEKISGGGVGTVRGYLEAEATGDHGAFASLELRGPSLAKWLGDEKGEWRCYAFGDWGILGVSEALPEEKTRFELVSVGLGSRIKLYDHFNGSIDAGVPLKSLSRTKAHDVRVLFQAGVSY